MVVKTRSISKTIESCSGIEISRSWQRVKLNPAFTSLQEKPSETLVMSRQSSMPERPETATLEKPSILDPNLSKKIDMTILSRENLKYVNNLVIKPIPKKATLAEQTIALNSLTAGFNTISGPNSLNVITCADSARLGQNEAPKASSFNPVASDNPTKLETNSKLGRVSAPNHVEKYGRTQSESKTKSVPNNNAQEEVCSKLTKLYRVINKNYRIRTSFRRSGKDKDYKSNMSRSWSKSDVIARDFDADAEVNSAQTNARLVKEDVKIDKAAGGKSKKISKKVIHKEKKLESSVVPKTSVRKPFAAKYKGRSRSGSRKLEENSGKIKKDSQEKKQVEHTKDANNNSNKTIAAQLKNTGKSKRGTGSAGSDEKPKDQSKKMSSPSSLSLIPVRKPKTEAAAVPVPVSPSPPVPPASLTVEHFQPVTKSFDNGYSLTEWIPVPPSSGRKPRLISCRFCSREFGTASFPVHESRCMQSWLNTRNNNKENATQIGSNQSDDLSNSGAQNKGETVKSEYQSEKGNKTNVKSKTDRSKDLDVTPKKSGTKKVASVTTPTGEDSAHQASPSPSTPLLRRPPTVLCHICNREFGSQSIGIHEPQCLHKWKLEQDKQNRHRHTSSGEKEGKQTQDASSDDVFWESHRLQLVPCRRCSRTFNPDRVIIHERSCKGRTPKKK